MSGQFQLELRDTSTGKFRAVAFDTKPVGFKEICSGPLLQEIMRQLIFRLAEAHEDKPAVLASTTAEWQKFNDRVDARLKEWGAR